MALVTEILLHAAQELMGHLPYDIHLGLEFYFHVGIEYCLHRFLGRKNTNHAKSTPLWLVWSGWSRFASGRRAALGSWP